MNGESYVNIFKMLQTAYLDTYNHPTGTVVSMWNQPEGLNYANVALTLEILTMTLLVFLMEKDSESLKTSNNIHTKFH
jgi:hypothetical protein